MSLVAFALVLGYVVGVLTTPTTEEIVWFQVDCFPWEIIGGKP